MKRFNFYFIFLLLISFYDAGAQCTATITPAGPVTFCSGGQVVLNANTAAGNTYVWLRNGVTVQSGTGSSYTASTAGYYVVQITTSGGCVAASTGLNVNILTNGNGITANGFVGIGCVNGGVNLSATVATGNSYQWKLYGGNISGATASTYSTSTVGTYTCQISNGSCSVLSNSINVIAQTATTNVAGPSVFCTSGNTSLSTTLNIGSGTTTYQWQKNNIDIPGQTFQSLAPSTSGDYRCRITSTGFCNAPTYSNNVNIQAGTAPLIYINTVAQGPAMLDLCGVSAYADVAVFDASTDMYYWGWDPITWYRNGYPLPSFGNVLYSVYQSGNYTADMVTACGTSYANVLFTLRILNPDHPPEITHFGNLPACAGLTLEVENGGAYFDSHQWKFNGAIIPGAISSSYNAMQSGDYSCIVSNSCGSLESAVKTITLYPVPAPVITSTTTNLCTGSSVTLSTAYNSNFNYRWRLNGVIISGATSSTYAATQAGSYDCKIYNNCADTVYTNAIVLNTVSLPTAVITAPVATSACTGSTVNLAANTSSGYIYRWLQNGVPLSNTGQAVYTATASGRYSVIITNSNGCIDTSESIPVFFGAPSVTVSSNYTMPVCPSQYFTLSAALTNGIADTYQWKLNGVDIPGKTSSMLAVTAVAAGTYSVTVSNPCGSVTSAGIAVTLKSATPASITATGPTGFCPPGSVTLNANTGTGLTYQWYRTYSNGPISGATGSSYTADTTGIFWVNVTSSATGCTASSNQIKASRTGIVATISVSGTVAACSTYVLTANSAPGFSYQWRKGGVNISGATSQSYTVTSTGTYTVAETGTCGVSISDGVSVEIYTGPFAYASSQIYPSGTSACSGSGLYIGINRFILPPYVSNISIQWLLNGSPLGAPVIPTSSNTVLYPAVTGNYSMQVTNVCGTMTSNVAAITINPLPSVTISAAGSTTICNGSSVVLNATTTTGNTRQWRRNNQVINNATAATYTATLAGSYTCEVTSPDGCKMISNEIDVISNGSIPSVQSAAGSYYICRSTTSNIYSIAPVSGASAYTWSVPTGATIVSGQGTTTISVDYSSTAATGNICVYATVACGSGASSCIPVRVVSSKPAAPASISGTTYPCASTTGKIYSCPTVTNAAGYTWTVPTGATITAGQGTDRITVDFSSAFVSGAIKVLAFNCKGNSANTSLNVYAIAVTPTLTGPSVGVCPNSSATYTINSTAGTTGFVWYAPGNASISSGQYTSQAIVYFNSQYVNDTLFVEARNSCGSSPKKSLIVKTVPNAPGTITGAATICANQSGVAYSIPAVTGATSYEWVVPAGAVIVSGQSTTSIVVNFATTAGYVKVRSGNACGYSIYRNKAVSVNCRVKHQLSVSDGITVFPIPASDEISISIHEEFSSTVNIRLYDITGKLIIEKSVGNYIAGEGINLDTKNCSAGSYMLKVQTESGSYMEKVIIAR
jgi:large repetitive protein